MLPKSNEKETLSTFPFYLCLTIHLNIFPLEKDDINVKQKIQCSLEMFPFVIKTYHKGCFDLMEIKYNTDKV